MSEFVFRTFPGLSPEPDESFNEMGQGPEAPTEPDYSNNEQPVNPQEPYEKGYDSDPYTQLRPGPEIDGVTPRVERMDKDMMLSLLNSLANNAAKAQQKFRNHTLTETEIEDTERKNYLDVVRETLKEKEQDMITSTHYSRKELDSNPHLFTSYKGRYHPAYATLLPVQIALAKAQAYLLLARRSALVELEYAEEHMKRCPNHDQQDFTRHQRKTSAYLRWIDSMVGLIEGEGV